MSHKPYQQYKCTGLQWLEKIPSHWEIVQSRRLFSQRKEKASSDDAQLTASQKYGVVYQAEFMATHGTRVVQVIKGADILKHVEPNDFVISMRSFQGGIEWSGLRGSISSAYVMLTPSANVNAAYFRYLLKCDSYIQALQSTSDLIRDGQALRFDNFAQIDLPVVPYEEQQTIAAHLDRETARIDALVEKKTRFIELLLEKRRALITYAATKGLDPSVKMKDSGVEWLGEVPVHWEVKPIKYLATHIGSGKTPPGGAEVYQDSGVMFLRSQNVHDDGLRLDDVAFISPQIDSEMQNSRVKTNDVLLNITGASIGRSCIVSDDIGAANVNQHVCIIRTKNREQARWVAACLLSQSIKAQIDFWQNGAGREGLNFEQIGNMTIPLPPQSEQKDISIYLDHEISRLDTLVQKTERSIELLKERRAALITAAVTGQIDLREAA